MTKICTQCLQEKDESAFHRSRSKRDGRKSQCKTCRAEANTWYRLTYPEKRRETVKKSQLKTTAQRALYRQNTAAQKKAYGKDYYQKNKIRIDTRTKQYKRDHPAIAKAIYARHRAKKRQARRNDLTAAQWEEIKAHYGHRCVYCGRKMQRLTKDHIIPLINGGAHTASNIVPACLSCNSKKHDGPPLKPVQPLLLTIAPPKKTRKR